jgi:hypothetical protein
MSMLAVEYFFEHREGAEGIDDMFKVSEDNMNFHLFQRA